MSHLPLILGWELARLVQAPLLDSAGLAITHQGVVVETELPLAEDVEMAPVR